jgi:hypothetical protein
VDAQTFLKEFDVKLLESAPRRRKAMKKEIKPTTAGND